MKHHDKSQFKVVSLGGATQDIIFGTDAGVLVDNRQDILRQQLIGFEFGAKIYLDQAELSFGGGAANTAVALARLGAKATSLVAVGDDQMGQSIVENLKKEKVATEYIQTIKDKTGFSVIITYGHQSTDHVLFTFRGANEDLVLETKNLDDIKPDWIFISSLSGKHWTGILNKVFAWAKKNKVKVAWNPGSLQIKQGIDMLEVYLKKTDVLLVNKDEALELMLKNNEQSKQTNNLMNPRQLLTLLGALVPGVVVITDGKKGAWAKEFSKVYFQEVDKVKKQDTTGVGDAFGATFVWGLEFFSGDVRAALEVASINAGAVIEKRGAQIGLLTKNQLLQRL